MKLKIKRIKEIIRGLPSRKVEPKKEDIKKIKAIKKNKINQNSRRDKKVICKTFLIPVDGKFQGIW